MKYHHCLFKIHVLKKDQNVMDGLKDGQRAIILKESTPFSVINIYLVNMFVKIYEFSSLPIQDIKKTKNVEDRKTDG